MNKDIPPNILAILAKTELATDEDITLVRECVRGGSDCQATLLRSKELGPWLKLNGGQLVEYNRRHGHG